MWLHANAARTTVCGLSSHDVKSPIADPASRHICLSADAFYLVVKRGIIRPNGLSGNTLAGFF
jgi:hypothetical protein